MEWYQVYSPVAHNIFLSALVAVIPILFLSWALIIKKMKGYQASLGTLVLALLIAVLVYKMPVAAAVSSTVLGILNGLFPIGYIILTSVLLYNLIVASGKFEVIKASIAFVTADRRLQVLLIAFAFSAFLEGAAGQGSSVAIAAAILIGLGFPPLMAAVVCLIANTPPVPFGPVGVPTMTLGSITGVSDLLISIPVGLNMAIFAIIVPFLCLIVMVGVKKTWEVLPAVLVTGVSYAVISYFIASTMGPALPSIITPLICMAVQILFYKLWKPKHLWVFPGETEHLAESASALEKETIPGGPAPDRGGKNTAFSSGDIVKAWSPFALVTVLMTIWGQNFFKNWIAESGTQLNIKSWPLLDGLIYKTAPIVSEPALYGASFKFDWLGYAGTAMLIAIFVSLFILNISFAKAGQVFLSTIKQLKFSLITVMSVIGFAYLANYSGMSYTLGLAFAATGLLFPIFSPVIGWLGVYLTGSVTSSAALFGKLQQATAETLGINPLVTLAAHTSGAVMGKLISPQSIAIACAATGMVGKETEIFRKVMKYSLILLGIVILMTLLEAYVFAPLFPHLPS